MNITRDQMMQRYKSLPTDLQDAIFSMENAQTLQNIGQIHKLRVDQIGVLADETGLVMLGFTKPNEFIPHLAERLKIDKELVRTIAHEVNDRIFIKVRDALRKIHGVKDNEIEEKAEINIKIQPEASSKVSDTIKPQSVLATEEESKKINFYEEEVRNKEQKQFGAKSSAMSQVAKTLERKPEVFKPEPIEKDIFSERMDEKGFRSPAEVVEKTEATPEKPKAQGYTNGADPYREPLE